MEAITEAGEALIAKKQAEGQTLVIDTFILANIQGQDNTVPIDRKRGLPDDSEVVYQSSVTKTGYIEPDSVVYSLFMGANTGPFSFNTLYLVCSQDENTVFAISTLPTVSKIANDIANGVRGTSMTRNFVIAFDGAQSLTTISVPAQAWQYDFTEATELQKGMIKLATLDEVDTGKDDTKAITPFKLKNWWDRIKAAFKGAAFLEAGQEEGEVAKIGNPSIAGNTAVVVSAGSNAYGKWRIWSDGYCEIKTKASFTPAWSTNFWFEVTLPRSIIETDFDVSSAYISHDLEAGGANQRGYVTVDSKSRNSGATIRAAVTQLREEKGCTAYITLTGYNIIT